MKYSYLVRVEWDLEISIFSSFLQTLGDSKSGGQGSRFQKHGSVRRQPHPRNCLVVPIAVYQQALQSSQRCLPTTKWKIRNQWGMCCFSSRPFMVKPNSSGRAWPSWRSQSFSASKTIKSTGFDAFTTKDFICSQYSRVRPFGCPGVLTHTGLCP